MIHLLFALLSAPAFAADAIPDQLFLRHARDLVPQFLEEQSRIYGVNLAVDVDSLVIPPFKMPDFAELPPLEFGAFGKNCRRVEGFLPGPHARAVFFVRAEGQRFKLMRTCEPRDPAPPRLAVELPGPRFERFTDDEFLALARPLLARLTPASEFTVKWPWFAPRPEATDFQNIFDVASPHDCRHVWFEEKAARGRVSVRIAYDATELRPGLPAEHQRIVTDPVRLRRFRVSLVDGCGWISRDNPARVHRRPL